MADNTRALTIEIGVNANDNTAAGLKSVQERLARVERSAQRTQMRLRKSLNREFRMTLRAIDQITPATGRIRSALRGLTSHAYRITVGIVDRATAPITRLRSVAASARAGLGAKMNGALSSLTGIGAGMIAGAGVLYGVSDTINVYKDFEAEISNVGAIAGASASDLDKLREAAMEMGGKSVYTSRESAEAMRYMAMAGWDANQIIAALPGVINAAAASGESLARVSDILTDNMTAFGMKANEATHFADILATVATSTNTNIAMLGESFKYAAPMAGQLQMSAEDTSLALGLMANAGIKASEAGTGLQAFYNKILIGNKKNAAAMETMGAVLGLGGAYEVADENGKIKPMITLVRDLRKMMQLTKGNDRLQGQILNGFGGAFHTGKLMTLAKMEDKEFEKLYQTILNCDGAAERIGKAKTANLYGDIKLLASAWELFQLELMKGSANNFLREFVQGATKDIEMFRDAIKDGLDFGDIAQLVGKVFRQLFAQFKEFSGIGSALAGGALFIGLYKLYSAISAIGAKLAYIIKGSGQAAVAAGQVAAEAAGRAGQVPADAATMTEARQRRRIVRSQGNWTGRRVTPQPPTLWQRAKGGMRRNLRASGAALALDAGIAGLSAWSAMRQSNAADAAYQQAMSQPNYDPKKLAELKQQKEQAQLDKRAAIGSGLGMVAGGAIGALIGGPVGAMIGGQLGGMVGEAIAVNLDDILAVLSKLPDKAIALAEDVGDGILAAITFPFKLAWELGSEACSWAWGNIKELWSAAGDWFTSNVTAPIGAAFTAVRDFISGAFSAAWDAVTGVWSAAGDWFSSNVIEPIKARWEAIKSLGDEASANATTYESGMGGAVAIRRSATPHAAGGIFGSPHFGLVAEAGPEAIIPLSASRRGRGLDLLGRSASAMGVEFGDVRPSGVGGGAISVEVGGVTFNIDGASPDVMGEINAHIEEFTDRIAGGLAEKLTAIYGNQAAFA